jgi:hypothetical protein
MDQAARLPDGTYARGSSGNPRGPLSRKARRDARMNDLAAEFGGIDALSPGDRRFLTEAVDLLLSITKTTNENHKVRIINTVNRIVTGIRERHAAAKREQPAELWGGPLVLSPLPDRADEPKRKPDAVEQPALDPRIENARVGDRIDVHDGLMGEDRVIEVTEDDDGDAPQ